MGNQIHAHAVEGGSESETFKHMLSCPSNSTLEFQTEQLVQLETNLRIIGTPEDLAGSIIHGISSWCHIQQGAQTSQHAPTVGSLTRMQ
jgi:hypothetical protein